MDDISGKQKYSRQRVNLFVKGFLSSALTHVCGQVGNVAIISAPFAGRRHEGKLQDSIEQAFKAAGVPVVVLSAYGTGKDLLYRHNFDLFICLIKSVLILAVLLGPPCEIWTVAG